jgi:heme exporter protein D
MPEFNFASLSDFFAMGGYALYVWLSFGATLLLLVWLALYSQSRQQRFLRELASSQAREARVRAHQQQESV